MTTQQLLPRDQQKEINFTVGSQIRTHRTLKNKSQEWLADQLGITFQQVQKYENGSNRVSAAVLQQISDALNISILSFFNDELEKDVVVLSRHAINIAQAYDNMPDSAVKQSLFSLIKSVNNKHLN